jgi:hypothetical protein
MWIASMEWHIRIRKPAYTSQFVFVVSNGLSSSRRDYVPKRYVNVACGEADRCRARDHQWFCDIMRSNKPKFFTEFAPHRISRMFPRLNVASGREPELRTFVIHEQDFPAVDHGEI